MIYFLWCFAETADNIDPTSIKIYMSNKTGEVVVYWDEPQDPNGLILSYDIHYSKVIKDVCNWSGRFLLLIFFYFIEGWVVSALYLFYGLKQERTSVIYGVAFKFYYFFFILTSWYVFFGFSSWVFFLIWMSLIS